MKLAISCSMLLLALACESPDTTNLKSKASYSRQGWAKQIIAMAMNDRLGGAVPQVKEVQFIRETEAQIFEQWVVEDPKGKLHPFEVSFTRQESGPGPSGIGISGLPYLPIKNGSNSSLRPLSRATALEQTIVLEEIQTLHKTKFENCELMISGINSSQPQPSGFLEQWICQSCGDKPVVYIVSYGPLRDQNEERPITPMSNVRVTGPRKISVSIKEF